jgi:dTDP-4-dehydrorhamnose 3,5-epimerase
VGLTATKFPGLYIFEPKVFPDGRGFFLESYKKALFDESGLAIDFLQDNHARSTAKGVLRGLHFQAPPSAQTKLVRVTRGAVLDVAVDVRAGSPTYGEHIAVELSEDNFTQLLVPRGFAHGYLTLTEDVEFLYKVDSYYDRERDGGLLWNDPDLGIDWGISEPILSDKDKVLPRLKDFKSPFVFEPVSPRSQA